MLLAPHILVGVAIITKVPNPVLGLLLVFLSHYFLDFFPHTEYSVDNIKSGQWSKSLSDFLKIFWDMALGLVIVFFTVGYTPLILIVVFLTILPDGLTLLYCIFPTNKLMKKHLEIHAAINAVCKNKKIPAVLGIINQVGIIALAIFFLL